MSQQLPPPPGMESDDEFENDWENEIEWDGIWRCESCSLELDQTADEANPGYPTCNACFHVLEDYIKLGLDHIVAPYTAKFDRDHTITITGPNKRDLAAAITDLYTYMGINDVNIVRVNHNDDVYEINREYEFLMISKPRNRPYQHTEQLMIEKMTGKN